ncbi:MULTISPECIES: alpha/beta hydrolase [Apilactobacillus]|uniref:Alpha/beta hydrolase n=2 Tax=Apilactobacillus TaxID=2767877 RepID=A0ABY2YXE6_9LACO|nr:MULTISPECIES: alpha/beta hydrolase [Apilactobacillus]TPR14856.1 alpha/beta hydrolase [Apilactobacillus timberlakei]TPR15826.1 alpha/beta hydrolase [Apilactobacillus timberlakei]TPR16187.1 alpha/beta hydrolase [Apilactobacillus timberlakei]TPR18143.1 alpha/beta hydrolase [Apilactobacillus timberlakei]TPR18927.1 alpha/beta hydrolase [Apilactobacillus timberlakei]
MHSRRKRKIIIGIVLFLEAIAFITSTLWVFRGRVLNDVKVEKSRTATIFIPGYGGNAVSTDDFINQFNDHGIAKRSLRIYISNDGKVSTMKQYVKKIKKDNPLVQLIFQDNTHPEKQADQMVNVMSYLHDKYNIKSVNFLGHSSGGTIAYEYMVKHPHQKNAPEANKFVSIANDYDPNDKRVKNLPRTLHVLNIAGEIYNVGTDGEEAVNIVKPMGKLVSPYVKSYQFYLYRADPLSAEHSMLHENPSLDKTIAEFLFNKHPKL